jgi:hypothetical protein
LAFSGSKDIEPEQNFKDEKYNRAFHAAKFKLKKCTKNDRGQLFEIISKKTAVPLELLPE